MTTRDLGATIRLNARPALQTLNRLRRDSLRLDKTFKNLSNVSITTSKSLNSIKRNKAVIDSNRDLRRLTDTHRNLSRATNKRVDDLRRAERAENRYRDAVNRSNRALQSRPTRAVPTAAVPTGAAGAPGGLLPIGAIGAVAGALGTRQLINFISSPLAENRRLRRAQAEFGFRDRNEAERLEIAFAQQGFESTEGSRIAGRIARGLSTRVAERQATGNLDNLQEQLQELGSNLDLRDTQALATVDKFEAIVREIDKANKTLGETQARAIANALGIESRVADTILDLSRSGAIDEIIRTFETASVTTEENRQQLDKLNASTAVLSSSIGTTIDRLVGSGGLDKAILGLASIIDSVANTLVGIQETVPEPVREKLTPAVIGGAAGAGLGTIGAVFGRGRLGAAIGGVGGIGLGLASAFRAPDETTNNNTTVNNATRTSENVSNVTNINIDTVVTQATDPAEFYSELTGGI